MNIPHLQETAKHYANLAEQYRSQLVEEQELNEDLLGLVEALCEELGIDAEELLEISLKTKIAAYAERANREFESDGDDPTDFTKSGGSKAGRTLENILKHHGAAAATHAERAALAKIFGHEYAAFVGPSVPAKGNKIVKKTSKKR